MNDVDKTYRVFQNKKSTINKQLFFQNRVKTYLYVSDLVLNERKYT